ncbi:hypothetical protein CUMW_146980 [Citrus unshiu]|nr:hypothetical protein CUMW_146980 [Citrus unshiu]
MSKEKPPEPLDFFIWTVESTACLGGKFWSHYNSYCKEILLRVPVYGYVYKVVLNLLAMYLSIKDVGLWLEEINLGGYRQIFKENGVNGEYLEGMSMFTTEQILRFIRRCHMKWGDFITLWEQKVRRPWWAPSCLSVVFVKVAKRNRQSRVVSLKLEP